MASSRPRHLIERPMSGRLQHSLLHRGEAADLPTARAGPPSAAAVRERASVRSGPVQVSTPRSYCQPASFVKRACRASEISDRSAVWLDTEDPTSASSPNLTIKIQFTASFRAADAPARFDRRRGVGIHCGGLL